MSRYLFLFLIFSQFTFSQSSKLNNNVHELTMYIANLDGQKFNSDLDKLDSIYFKSLSICKGDKEDALISLTFTCVPYKKIHIHIPVLNILYPYTFLNVPDSIFTRKNYNLPKELYYDTPLDDYGDRDKPGHFFGAAYLSNGAIFFDLGNLIGYFVEVFEEVFELQNSVDIRDLRTNSLGDYFGKLIEQNNNIRPSDLFKFYNITNIIFPL